MSLRIALLRSDGPHHRYLERLLAGNFDLVCVVEEPAREQIRRLRERRKWTDWFWWQYHAVRRRFLGLDRYRQRYFANAEVALTAASARPVQVRSINEELAIHALADSKPDATVIIGTSILRRHVLNVAGPVVINIHGGFLPHYRGNHCFFFALYDGRSDLAGSTIHFIDEGVDTGDIIEHVPADAKPEDNAETLYCRAEKRAIERLVELLKAYELRRMLPRKPQGTDGRTFRTRDRKPHHDILLWIRRNCG